MVGAERQRLVGHLCYDQAAKQSFRARRSSPGRTQASGRLKRAPKALLLEPLCCIDHGQDARAESFGQRRPGVENVLQAGIERIAFRGLAQAGRKRRNACRC
jgi:hypothetical protein